MPGRGNSKTCKYVRSINLYFCNMDNAWLEQNAEIEPGTEITKRSITLDVEVFLKELYKHFTHELSPLDCCNLIRRGVLNGDWQVEKSTISYHQGMIRFNQTHKSAIAPSKPHVLRFQ